MTPRALRRRYGRAYGLPVERRSSYSIVLWWLNDNPDLTPGELRREMQEAGTHKAVTNRILSIAERRGHVRVRAGRYSITPRGVAALEQGVRG